MRNGQTEEISTANLLVGDILLLDTGDILAADGLLFQGNDIRQAMTLIVILEERITGATLAYRLLPRSWQSQVLLHLHLKMG